MGRQRRMRLTYKQLKLLVKFMVDNPLVAKGVDYRTALGKHYHDTKWSELADLLNSQDNGVKKSPREWNRYWKDLKAGIKKKVHATNAGNRKMGLSGMQRIIYNECMDKHGKFADHQNDTYSYLHIPEMDDDKQENYEVEYLEDSCDGDSNRIDHTQLVTDDSDMCLNDLEAELNGNNEAELDDDHPSDDFINKWLTNKIIPGSVPSRKSEILNNLLENDQFLKSVYNEPKHDSRESIVNNENLPSDDTSSVLNPQMKCNILHEIRNQLKELVALQKDRANSAQRIAAAHERRAILEEKKIKIEEKRLKMEERRLELEEKIIEVSRRRALAEERIATAVEKRNKLKDIEVDTGT